jgi:hypothetical protein
MRQVHRPHVFSIAKLSASPELSVIHVLVQLLMQGLPSKSAPPEVDFLVILLPAQFESERVSIKVLSSCHSNFCTTRELMIRYLASLLSLGCHGLRSFFRRQTFEEGLVEEEA